MTFPEDIENWFTYHKPDDTQVARIQAVRDAALAFAHVIHGNTPVCDEQRTALRKLREAVMTSNAAIVCHRDG